MFKVDFCFLLFLYINDAAIVQLNQYYRSSNEDHYYAVDSSTVPTGFVFDSYLGYVSNIQTNNNHRLCQKYNDDTYKIGRWTPNYNCQYYLDYPKTTSEVFYAWSTLNGCLNDMPSGYSCTKLLEYRRLSNNIWVYMYVTNETNIKPEYTIDNDIGDIYIGILVITGPTQSPSITTPLPSSVPTQSPILPSISPTTASSLPTESPTLSPSMEPTQSPLFSFDKSKNSDNKIGFTVVLLVLIPVFVIIML